MAKNIRLKISGHIEGNYKRTERDYGHTTTKTTTATMTLNSPQAKGIRVKISGKVRGM